MRLCICKPVYTVSVKNHETEKKFAEPIAKAVGIWYNIFNIIVFSCTQNHKSKEIAMILDKIHELSAFDAEIGAAVEAEYNRQRDGLELIASENVVSEAVLLAAGTILTN